MTCRDKELADSVGHELACRDVWEAVTEELLADALLPGDTAGLERVRAVVGFLRGRGLVCGDCHSLHRTDAGVRAWPTGELP